MYGLVLYRDGFCYYVWYAYILGDSREVCSHHKALLAHACLHYTKDGTGLGELLDIWSVLWYVTSPWLEQTGAVCQ